MEFSTDYELGDLGETPLTVHFDIEQEGKPVITKVFLIGDKGSVEITELCSGQMIDSLADSADEYLDTYRGLS